MKLEQLIAATANMLPDELKENTLKRISAMQQLYRVREYGLTEAIRVALESKVGQWLTVSSVRDQLLALGFDFSNYTSNPLASISAVLRRMKDEEVETTTVDGGVAAYRWKQPKRIDFSKLMKAAAKARQSDIVPSTDFSKK